MVVTSPERKDEQVFVVTVTFTGQRGKGKTKRPTKTREHYETRAEAQARADELIANGSPHTVTVSEESQPARKGSKNYPTELAQMLGF